MGPGNEKGSKWESMLGQGEWVGKAKVKRWVEGARCGV